MVESFLSKIILIQTSTYRTPPINVIFEQHEKIGFLWCPSRRSTVYDAVFYTKQMVGRYLRLCARRGRQVAIVNVRLVESLLAALPCEIEDELRIQGKHRTIQDITENATIIEYEFRRRRKPKSTTHPVPMFAAAPLETKKREPTGPCHGCGNVGHWRKHCPFREHRCEKCQIIGHVSSACKNYALKDSQGRVRQRIQQKQGRIQSESTLDHNHPSRVMTAQDVLNKVMLMAKQKSEKARIAREKKNTELGIVPKRTKKEHPVAVAIPDGDGQMGEFNTEEVFQALTSLVEDSENEISSGSNS